MTESAKQLLTRCSIPTKFEIDIKYCGSFRKINCYNNIPYDDIAQLDFTQIKKMSGNKIKGFGELFLRTNSPQKITVKNEPMTVQLCGHLYDKPAVLLPNGYVVPVEADVFLDCMLNGGIDENHVLKSKMFIVSYEQKTRLIREDSNLADSIKQYVAKTKRPKVKIGELERGALYKTAQGSYAVFLGYVGTTEYVNTETNEIEKKQITKATLWKEMTLLSDYCIDDFLKQYAIESTNKQFVNIKNLYNVLELKLVKRHNYIEKIPGVKFKIDNNVVSDIAGHFYEETRQLIKKQKKIYKEWKENKNYKGRNFRVGILTSVPWEIRDMEFYNYVSKFVYNSKLYNMVLYGVALEAGERKDLIYLSKL